MSQQFQYFWLLNYTWLSSSENWEAILESSMDRLFEGLVGQCDSWSKISHFSVLPLSSGFLTCFSKFRTGLDRTLASLSWCFTERLKDSPLDSVEEACSFWLATSMTGPAADGLERVRNSETVQRNRSGEHLLPSDVNRIRKGPRSSCFFDPTSDTFLSAQGTGVSVVLMKMLVRTPGSTHTTRCPWERQGRQLWSRCHHCFSTPVCFFFLCVFSCSFP